MSDLRAEIMAVVARLKGEVPTPVSPPAPAVQETVPAEAPAPRQAPEAPATIDELARVLGLPLDQLDRVLRVAVPWLEVPLWFVPGEADAEALVATGEAFRGAVWTRLELLDLWSAGLTNAGARRVAEAKLAVGGEVIAIRRSGRRRPARPGEPGTLA